MRKLLEVLIKILYFRETLGNNLGKIKDMYDLYDLAKNLREKLSKANERKQTKTQMLTSA